MRNVDGLELEEREQCFSDKHACRAGVDFSIIRSLYESLLGVSRCAAGAGWRTLPLAAIWTLSTRLLGRLGSMWMLLMGIGRAGRR